MKQTENKHLRSGRDSKLTLWSSHSEKPRVPRLVKEFPEFYVKGRSIAVFTTARNLSLTWARSIQSPPSHPISRIPVLILSSHLLVSQFVCSYLVFPSRLCMGPKGSSETSVSKHLTPCNNPEDGIIHGWSSSKRKTVICCISWLTCSNRCTG